MSSMDDVNIFEPEPRRVRGSRATSPLPSLTPAQLANLAASFAPGAATTDIFGEFPEFPRGNMTVEQMMSGPRAPSLRENLREGDYLSALLQGLGGVGDVASGIPIVGMAAGSVLKAPRAAQRLLRAKEAGFDTDTVYYHGTDADITEFRMPSRETGQTKTADTGVFMSSSPEVAGSYAIKLDSERAPSIYPVYINKKEFLTVRPAEKGQMWSDIPTDGLVVEFPDGTTKPASKVFKLEDDSTSTDELSRIAKAQGRKGLIIEGVVDAGIGTAGEYRYAGQYLKDKGYDVSLPAGNTKENYDKLNAVPSEVMREARLYAKEQLYRPADVVVSFDPKNIRSVNAEFEDFDTADISKAKGGAIDIDHIDIFEPVQNFVLGGGVRKGLSLGKKDSQTNNDDAEKGIGSIPVDDETLRGNDLQFLMNTGPGAIEKAQRLGGFPMPSLAITRQDLPFETFGEITLVGSPSKFDPGKIKANVVFNADAYTVRAPRPFRIAKKNADRDFQKKYTPIAKEFDEGGVDSIVYELGKMEMKKTATETSFGDVKDFFVNDPVADVAFLRDQGDTRPIPKNRYGSIDRSEVRKMVDEYGDARRMWDEDRLNEFFEPEEFFDASVNRDFYTGKGRIFKPYTGEEVVKFMKKRRGAAQEEGMFTISPGKLRASLTERLTSLKKIKEESPSLVDEEKFKEFKDKSYDRVANLAESLKPFYRFDGEGFRYLDEVIELLIESEKRNLSSVLKNFGFDNVPDSVIEEIQGIKSYFRTAPTQYFEAKPQRLVDLEEFEGAIVPKDTPANVLQAFEDAGIKIEYYTDSAERLSARKKFAGTAFSLAGGITLVGLIAPQEVEAGVGVGAATMTPETQAKVKEMKTNLAGVETGLDALSAMYSPVVGGLAGLGQYTKDLPLRLAARLTGADRDTLDIINKLAGEKVRDVRQKMTAALDYEPSTPEGRQMSREAQEGIAQLARPIVETVQPPLTKTIEQIQDPDNVTPLGLLYQGGKYLYEDIFGEAEREAAKSAMDVAL